MTLYESRGRLTLQEAEVQQQFSGLQSRLSALALASYLAEVLATEAEDAPGGEQLLRLALNCLYALSHGLAPEKIVKAAFELRYMTLAGYAPELSGCAVCGRAEPVRPVAVLEAGVIRCRACSLPGASGQQTDARRAGGSQISAALRPEKAIFLYAGRGGSPPPGQFQRKLSAHQAGTELSHFGFL